MKYHRNKYNNSGKPFHVKGVTNIMHDQNFLNEYFANKWTSSLDDYIYSGKAIVNKIHKDCRVLDVGCGSNHFKEHFPNLVGIDPASAAADVLTTIEDYETDIKFDVALCLGSINFGGRDVVARQIAKVVSLLNDKSRVYWRLNPGWADHDHEDCNQIQFFPWSFETLYEFACQHGFHQVNAHWDTNGKHRRLYVEWWRSQNTGLGTKYV